MYVAVVPNRGSPPAILLRESYREAGKTKNRTLANLSRWPRALTRSTQKPFSGLWKGDAIDQAGQKLGWCCRFGDLHHSCMMNTKILRRYEIQRPHLIAAAEVRPV